MSVCWAKVGKAKLIARPTRATTKRLLIVPPEITDLSSIKRPAAGFLQAPGTSMSRGVRGNALARHLSDSQRKDHVSSASMGDFPGTDIASVDFPE